VSGLSISESQLWLRMRSACEGKNRVGFGLRPWGFGKGGQYDSGCEQTVSRSELRLEAVSAAWLGAINECYFACGHALLHWFVSCKRQFVVLLVSTKLESSSHMFCNRQHSVRSQRRAHRIGEQALNVLLVEVALHANADAHPHVRQLLGRRVRRVHLLDQKMMFTLAPGKYARSTLCSRRTPAQELNNCPMEFTLGSSLCNVSSTI